MLGWWTPPPPPSPFFFLKITKKTKKNYESQDFFFLFFAFLARFSRVLNVWLKVHSHTHTELVGIEDIWIPALQWQQPLSLCSSLPLLKVDCLFSNLLSRNCFRFVLSYTAAAAHPLRLPACLPARVCHRQARIIDGRVDQSTAKSASSEVRRTAATATAT